MQIKRNIFAIIVVMCLMPFALKGQSSSTSVFSPYTLYGVGELSSGAPTFLRAMGSAGVAYSSPIHVNYLNPASNSAVMPNTFLLSIGAEGGGSYLSSNSSKTSGNTFNFSDISLRFPLAKGVGFSFSLTPYSSLGYSMSELDDLSYTEEVDYNAVMNTYTGEGSISQFKAGVGARLFKNFSLGADLVYYAGTLVRSFNTVILTNNSGSKDFAYVNSYTQTLVSSFSANFGLQYMIPLKEDNFLTLGATYLLGGQLNNQTTRVVPTNNEYGDNAEYDEYTDDISFPSVLSVGMTLRGRRYAVSADYVFSEWSGTNDAVETTYDYIKYHDTHQVRVGGEYTPNRHSMRSYASRMTYRVGASYGNNYLSFYDETMSTTTITMGASFPVGQSRLSSVNVSLELGQTGTKSSDLFRQQYFKISAGFNFFGEDQWFVKPKLN